MDDESVSLESIVAYKKDIFSASDAESYKLSISYSKQDP